MLTSMILSSRWVHFLRQPIAALLKQLIGLHDVAQLHATLSVTDHPAHVNLWAAICAVSISHPGQGRAWGSCLAWGG